MTSRSQQTYVCFIGSRVCWSTLLNCCLAYLKVLTAPNTPYPRITSASNLNALFLKQKIAIRLIYSEKFNAHSEPLFKKSNILPLHMLVDYFKLQFFHRFTSLLPIPGSKMKTEDKTTLLTWTITSPIHDSPPLKNFL